MNSMLSLSWATALIERSVYRFASILEEHKVFTIVVYSAVFLVFCTLWSATKLMWYDEMATYYPAKLPTASAVVDFFQQGNDVPSPVASLVAWAAMKVLGDGPVVDRLPFTLGYLVFCISIFLFVARRCPAV